MRQKTIQRDELSRPRIWALEIERDLAAARVEYWDLLSEFVARASELEIRPRTWQASSQGGYVPRITWVEGYPLTNGTFVSAPPLRYCVAERRLVRRAQPEVTELPELSLFVISSAHVPGSGDVSFEHQTVSGGDWPRFERMEHAVSILAALRNDLEKSLLALMD